MMIFELVAFEPDEHVTLLARRFTRASGTVAVTYRVTPRGTDACRLVGKTLVVHPGGSAERLLRRSALPLLELVMARKQMHTLRDLAQDAAGAKPAMLGAT